MTVNKYAIIKNDTVINTILLDTDSNYHPPEGTSMVLVTDEVSVDWEHKEGKWKRPNRHEPEGPTEDPSLTQAKNTALAELIKVGISDASARLILGLPPSAKDK